MNAPTQQKTLARRAVDTPVGRLRIAASALGLCAVQFEKEEHERESTNETVGDPSADTVLSEAVHELEGYFRGELTEFTVPLDVSGSPFQRDVWSELRRITYGTTVSYLALAQQLGDPGAVRAVARANARNPVAIIIPCHRVIGSDGSLTGYAGGLWRKRKLLEHEAKCAGRPYQSSLFG